MYACRSKYESSNNSVERNDSNISVKGCILGTARSKHRVGKEIQDWKDVVKFLWYLVSRNAFCLSLQISIIDKKSLLSKITDPNEQFQHLIIDILMYCKYKLLNGISVGDLIDLLRKTKTALLKTISSPDFLKALIIASNTESKAE